MESHVLEKIQWESCRVAAAFGIESPKIFDPDNPCDRVSSIQRFMVWSGPKAGYLSWGLIKISAQLQFIELGNGADFCRLILLYEGGSVDDGNFAYIKGAQAGLDEVMARGLYRLGFEDESILSQLPSLSAHEQLELRLSMPRKFWPSLWVEESS